MQLELAGRRGSRSRSGRAPSRRRGGCCGSSLAPVAIVLHGDLHALGEEAVNVAVGGGGAHGHAVAEEVVDGEVDGSAAGGAPGRVEAVDEARAEAGNEHDVAQGGAAEGRRVGPEGLASTRRRCDQPRRRGSPWRPARRAPSRCRRYTVKKGGGGIDGDLAGEEAGEEEVAGLAEVRRSVQLPRESRSLEYSVDDGISEPIGASKETGGNEHTARSSTTLLCHSPPGMRLGLQ